MKISFVSESAPASDGVIARFVNFGDFPSGLEHSLAEGARISRFEGKADQLFETFIVRDDIVIRVALVGIGEPNGEERKGAIERAGAALSAAYLCGGITKIELQLDGMEFTPSEVASALLGFTLRCWRMDSYRTTLAADARQSLEEILITGAPEGAEAAWKVESSILAGVSLTKELVTEPGNVLYPESFVERCLERMAGSGLSIRALDEQELAELGMGALLGVAQGSYRPARLLVIEWKGGEADEPPFALVGKGVTFDSGGISIKPSAGMEEMKWDMGGAGAVAGTMLAIALRKAKANVVAVCGLVENMPDGNAQRPGDVVTSMSGQTIEVVDTDAEGRLVLCDALTWVQREYQPKQIVDLATLTGAIIMSLGKEYAGLFSNSDALADALFLAGSETGDKLWRMPMGAVYDKMLDSSIADMKNLGQRFGGAITAAQFLARFVEAGTEWAHLDIAGTVWSDKSGATWDKGATGFGVRLLDQFVRSSVEKLN